MFGSHQKLIQKIKKTGVNNEVIKAMSNIDHKDFLILNKELAYLDRAVPLNNEVTISQPTLVAKMIDYLNLDSINIVLELGTGSAYSAAIISQLVPYGHLTTIERINSLCKRATKLLKDHYNVRVVCCDALKHDFEHLYDRIIVTTEFLTRNQMQEFLLKNAAKFCICIYLFSGSLWRLTKIFDEITEEELISV